MKVTLDLSRLLQDGAITHAEHDRLALLGRQDTGSLLVNILIGFGVISVAAGCIALAPSAVTGIVLGAVLMAMGGALLVTGQAGWAVLANICILVAALLLAAGIVLASQGWLRPGDDGHSKLLSFNAACLLVSLLFVGSAVLARSALLAALAVIVLFVLLGSSSTYDHAFYELEVRQPLLTVMAFSALALAAHSGSRVMGQASERLLTTAARTSLFLVNLGFWVGSLWGDHLDFLRDSHGGIGPVTFSVAWALALLATAIWAGWSNRRWALNLVTVFAGIHFYTQWFEHLGATPVSVLVAGVVVLGAAILLWRLNQRPVRTA
jgi:hypothetical protein